MDSMRSSQHEPNDEGNDNGNSNGTGSGRVSPGASFRSTPISFRKSLGIEKNQWILLLDFVENILLQESQ